MGICVECGLCCDGTLFVRAGLVENDPLGPILARGGTVVTLSSGKRELRLPCPALDNRCCTTYDSRPRICSDFRCRLLQAVEKGSVQESAAIKIAADTTAQRDHVRVELQALVGGSDFDAMGTLYARLLAMRDSATEPRQFELAHAELFMKVAGLRYLLLRHYISPEPDQPSEWSES